jgi:hypothetical protein
MEPAALVMKRLMLLGSKERAERVARADQTRSGGGDQADTTVIRL